MAELTQEEKDKIFEEEKERRKAIEELGKESSSIKFGNLISLIGAAMMVVGLFLPWATLGALSVSGFAKSGDAKYLLVAGIGIGLISLAGMAMKKSVGLIVFIFSILSGGLLLYLYTALTDNLSDKAVLGVSAQIGSGFWLSCAGVVIALIGAISTVKVKKK